MLRIFTEHQYAVDGCLPITICCPDFLQQIRDLTVIRAFGTFGTFREVFSNHLVAEVINGCAGNGFGFEITRVFGAREFEDFLSAERAILYATANKDTPIR